MIRTISFGAFRVVAALALFVAAVIAIGSGGTARAQDGASVDIVDFAFDPSSVTIEAGGTVTWTNVGDAPHTVTSDDGTFDSGELANGDTFSSTFDEPGTYTYHCDIHPDMTAEIIVTESGGNTTDGNGGDTGDDTTDTGDGDTELPSTGVGTAATHGTPWVLLILSLVLAASGLLVSRRHPAR
ncbi:MAG: hypothetical protein QOJ59_591 [Thermomicrobiales bacterium]|jgi:plastocyanin|nr:hypothetical protein [Thermomicrobiales bacterium]